MTLTEQIIKELEGKELESILINATDNSLELRVSKNGQSTERLVLEGILELKYAPDFSDFGPWYIIECHYQSDLLKNIIDELSLLWTKEAPAVKNWLDQEIHRVKMFSGDFELIVTFKKIKTGNNNT